MKFWACVTGAGSGIGRSITLDLVSRDIGVFAIGRRLENLEDTKTKCKNPDNVIICQADVASEEGRKKIQETVGNKELKYLIHNAGVVGPLKSIKDLQIDEYRQVMAINVEAPIFLTKILIPNLIACGKKEGNPARILHVSSGCAHNPSMHWLTYCVSKAAFLMAYRCLALDLQPENILIGSFKPGIVDTPMQDQMRLVSEEDFPKVTFFKKLKVEREKQLLNSKEDEDQKPRLPSKERLDTPENVAHFAWFLLNETSNEEFSQEDWDIRDEKHAPRWT